MATIHNNNLYVLFPELPIDKKIAMADYLTAQMQSTAESSFVRPPNEFVPYIHTILPGNTVVIHPRRLKDNKPDLGQGLSKDCYSAVLITPFGVQEVAELVFAHEEGLVDEKNKNARMLLQLAGPSCAVSPSICSGTIGEDAICIMQKYDGNLADLLVSASFPQRLQYASAIFKKLKEFHDLGFTHNDLTPENVFFKVLNGKPEFFLADFDTMSALLFEDPAVFQMELTDDLTGFISHILLDNLIVREECPQLYEYLTTLSQPQYSYIEIRQGLENCFSA